MLGKVRGSDSQMSQSRAAPSPSSARGSNDTDVNTPKSVGKRRALRGSSWEVKLKTPECRAPQEGIHGRTWEGQGSLQLQTRPLSW